RRDALPIYVQAGVVWIISTDLFDAAAGFGGYKESGFGREGGREGMFEYLRPAWQRRAAAAGTGGTAGPAGPTSPSGPADGETPAARAAANGSPGAGPDADGAEAAGEAPGIDRTPTLYIGGPPAGPVRPGRRARPTANRRPRGRRPTVGPGPGARRTGPRPPARRRASPARRKCTSAAGSPGLTAAPPAASTGPAAGW